MCADKKLDNLIGLLKLLRSEEKALLEDVFSSLEKHHSMRLPLREYSSIMTSSKRNIINTLIEYKNNVYINNEITNLGSK